MITSLIKCARIVAIVALAYASTYSESALGRGGTPGTCGFLLTMDYSFAYLYGTDPGNGFGMNALGTINFQTNTISINLILADPAGPDSVEYPFAFTTTFTTSAGPVPGSSTIMFTIPNTTTVLTFNLLPVNGGKTMLMQLFFPDGDGSVTGRCEV